jgi:hypothetical protein
MTSNREKSVDGYSTECILLYYPVYMGVIRLNCFGMVDPTTGLLLIRILVNSL